MKYSNNEFFCRNLILIITLINCSQLLIAQSNKHDTLPSPNYKPVNYTTFSNFIDSDVDWKLQDTVFDSFSLYDQTQHQKFQFANLGNIGSSHRILDYRSNSFGFNYKKVPLSEYLFSENNIKIFKPSSPYTHLYYIAGSGKHQFLGGHHAQQIKQFLVGVNFNIINSLGTYQRQKTNVSEVSAYINYSGLKKHYNNTLLYFFNSVLLQENGGLQIDSLFNDNIEPYRPGMPIRMQSAQNMYKEHNVVFSQSFSPFNVNDSLQKGFDFGSFIHTMNFSSGKWLFSDSNLDSTFLYPIYRDSLNTNDSSVFIHLRNTIDWKNRVTINLRNNSNVLLLSGLGLTHQFMESSDSTTSFYNQSWIARANLGAKKDSIWLAKYSFQYILFGYGKNAFEHVFNVKYFIEKEMFVSLYYKYQSNPQTYFLNNYHSNYHQWNNNFAYLVENMVGLSFESKIIDLGADAIYLKNYVYLNSQLCPEMYEGKISIYRFWAEIAYQKGIVHSLTKLTYNLNNADSILMFPEFTIREHFFLQFPMFHHAMLANVGFDALFVPEYFGAYYEPSLFDFYQNKSKKIGNFVYLDLFVGFKVKRFNFFFKLINAPKGLLPYNYYSSPSYPLPDRQFRIGFSWRFYD